MFLSKEIPDYKGWAESMGCFALRVDDPDEVEEAIAQANEIEDRPVVIDFRTAAEEKVYPMVAAGTGNSDVIVPPSQENEIR